MCVFAHLSSTATVFTDLPSVLLIYLWLKPSILPCVLNETWPPGAHEFEYLVPVGWCCLGRRLAIQSTPLGGLGGVRFYRVVHFLILVLDPSSSMLTLLTPSLPHSGGWRLL